MYNRYSMEIRDDDFVPMGRRDGPDRPDSRRRPPPPPGPMPPPPPGPVPAPPHGPPLPGPVPPVHNGGTGGGPGPLFGGLHLRQLETDDLLLLGVAWLILRESGDEDLFLILAVLFLLGAGD